MYGEVVWFNNAKGYGFVRATTTGDDYFIHHSEITMDGYRTLKEKQKVEFEVIAGGPHNRLQAVNVKLVE